MEDLFFKQLAETFNTELESLLQLIISKLQDIQEQKEDDLIKRREEITQSWRNIKVSASAIEANDISLMAQYLEKLYASVAPLSPEINNLTLRAVDAIRKGMQSFCEKKPVPPDFDDLIRQIELQLVGVDKAKVPLPAPEESIAQRPKEADTEFLTQIIEVFKAELEEKLLVITNGLLELESGRESENDFIKTCEEIFRAAHTVKGSGRGVGAADLAEIAHHIETLFSAIQKKTVKISPEIINLCLKAVDAMRIAMQCYSIKQPLSFDLQALLTQLHQSAESKPITKVEPQIEVAPLQTKATEYESIRVALYTLDRVSAFIEEMQINKIAIEDHYAELVKVNLKVKSLIQSLEKKLPLLLNNENDNIKKFFHINMEKLKGIGDNLNCMHQEMHRHVSELKTIFNALQDEVRMLRLVPVTMQLGNMPRIVRDLAYNLQKQVNLEIKDNNVKIDKMVLDGLKDPIVHILRNSIDHGIENSDVRKSFGKPEKGMIRIEVCEEGNHILFKISDDGAGIDLDKLVQTALRKKILTKFELETMTKEEILELIFRPGFSTKEDATDVSGRGIGLDVVRSNLTILKGQVNLTTEVGKGTVFYLRVPLTLATERGLIVQCEGQLFSFITSSVSRVLTLKQQDIINVEGCEAIIVNNQPILLGILSEVLDLEEKNKTKKSLLPTVIIKKDWKSVAIVVDEILGEKEIVLKPLQAPITNIPYVIGATLSGSNQIIFVLNSADIITKVVYTKQQIAP